MKFIFSVFAGVGVCLLIAFVLLGTALGAEPSDYRGSFHLSDATQAEADRDRAVDVLSAQVPGLFRSLFRQKVRAAATVTRFFNFQPVEGRMTIASDRAPQGWTTDLGATEVEVISDDGQRFVLARWFEDGALNSRGRSRRGGRQSRFELSPDGGQLAVTTTISHRFFPEPLVYRSEYVRTPKVEMSPNP